MNRNRLWLAVVLTVIGVLTVKSAESSTIRLGLGVNYWEAVDSVRIDNIDNDGFGYVLSAQYKPALFGFGLDFEILPSRFDSDSYAPQAYLLVGGLVYAGAGIGFVYADSSFADDPFYSFRAGLDLRILPRLHLDIYGQYRFESRQDLKDEDARIDTDTVYLGAAVRLGF